MRWIHRLGGVVTRLLLAPGIRRFPPARSLYRQLYVLGKRLAEPRERRFFQDHVQQGMVVLDIGANVGFYSLFFAGLVGPSGRVLAFEPDPVSFGLLAQQAAGQKNLEAIHTALGDREGRLTLYCSLTNRADNRVHESHGSPVERIEVPLTTIDSSLPGIERVDAVKMDVQGAEVAVLAGGRETLRRTRPAWMLIEFSPEHLLGAGSSPEAFWQALAEHGYEPWSLEGEPAPIRDTAAFTRRYEDGYTDVWARRV